MVVKDNHSKSDHGETTRDALIGAGRRLFGSAGYGPTSLDAIVAEAGVTKGAVYHHFTGKEDLFAAVFEGVKRELSGQLAPALQDPDPWTGLKAACRTYIEIHTEPAVARIVLLDARSVLDPDAWRRVDSQWGAVMFRGAFRRATNRGVISPLPLHTLAKIVTGALAEACLIVAEAEDPQRAREESMDVVERLLEGLRG